jgi:hypothetical protein
VGDIHNELTQAFALQSAYQAALGAMQSGFSGIERAGETLTPVMDLWSLPEWSFLRTEVLFSSFLAQTKVAAEKGSVAVVNPSTSRSLAIVERITRRTADAAGTFNVFITTEALIQAQADATAAVNTRDQRNGVAQGVARLLIVRGGSAAGLIVNNLENFTSTGAMTETGPLACLPVVLEPGKGLVVEHGTINLDIAACFAGRVRTCLHGELQP